MLFISLPSLFAWMRELRREPATAEVKSLRRAPQFASASITLCRPATASLAASTSATDRQDLGGAPSAAQRVTGSTRAVFDQFFCIDKLPAAYPSKPAPFSIFL